eukprot:SAG25_NODE_9544_length_368_cov_0.944238_1_plen_44_part_10
MNNLDFSIVCFRDFQITGFLDMVFWIQSTEFRVQSSEYRVFEYR